MLEIFIAFYAAGVAIALYGLFGYQTIRVIKELAPNNIMSVKPIMSGNNSISNFYYYVAFYSIYYII